MSRSLDGAKLTSDVAPALPLSSMKAWGEVLGLMEILMSSSPSCSSLPRFLMAMELCGDISSARRKARLASPIRPSSINAFPSLL